LEEGVEPESPGKIYWGVRNNDHWIRSFRKSFLGYIPVISKSSNTDFFFIPQYFISYNLVIFFFFVSPVIYFLDHGGKSYPQFVHKKKLRMWIKKY
jgi:hypothetical protein